MKTGDVQNIVDSVIEKVGQDIRLGAPLGAGKSNLVINAFYQKAKNNPQIKLKIFTALTLNKPEGQSLLEKNFLGPFVERVFGDYPNLDYETDRNKQNLPPNIEVIEFYFPAGKQLNNRTSQENYVSSNYTHVARDLFDSKVNVITQMIAPSNNEELYSLSCNPDVTGDLLQKLIEKKPYPFAYIGQVNNNLPFMYGDAVLEAKQFDFILDNDQCHYKIFGPPKMSVPERDHLIGFYSSTLVKDGGELQVGIGSLGDALVASLELRQKNNEQYKAVFDELGVLEKFGDIVTEKGSLGTFEKGLFGASEMFVDSFRFLIEADIMKKKVYDHVVLQRLLNGGEITETVNAEMFFLLLESRAIQPVLRNSDFKFLQDFGIFKGHLDFKDGYIILPDGRRIEGDLNEDQNSSQVIDLCLGDKLKNGAIIHGGFFLGPQSFYDWLNNMPEEQRQLIHMKSVSKINQLYGHEDIDRLHRKDARFVNTCLIMTLSGAAVSDGLEDGRVVSGVGGQYNFVAMAHALPDGHSVIQLRSTRGSGENTKSSIVFNYGHITIPRHLRDIVVTEYGIADLRGKTDSDVAAALIEISDSRFQQELMDQAKAAGKLKQSYKVPKAFQNNYPEELHKKVMAIRNSHSTAPLFETFPFGTDFTEEEIVIGRALKSLKAKTKSKKAMAKLLAQTALVSPTEKQLAYLKRMKLDQPKNFKEKLYHKLLCVELSQS